MRATWGNFEVYLLRHGETEWNTQGRFQGKLDSPLTERGVAQAKACGAILARNGVRWDALHASPLGRVRQTTAILSECLTLPKPQWDWRLAEVSIGLWDGLTDDDIEAGWPGRLDGSNQFDWFFRAPGGESYADACMRVRGWLTCLEGTVVAVSDGLIGRIIRGQYLGLDRAETLELPVPQDVVWNMRNGIIDRLTI